jgi:hypothetical protein
MRAEMPYCEKLKKIEKIVLKFENLCVIIFYNSLITNGNNLP